MQTGLMWLKTRDVVHAKSLLIAALLLVVAATAWGQIDRGTIQGLVKDTSGLGIPDAKVQVILIDTNSALDLETNMEGLYTAPNLPSDFDPATSRFLNPAAFTTSTGFNFGNLAPVLSWVRGFWGKQEALTLGKSFRMKERFTFDFSVDATNPFNFVRWSNPNTNLLTPAFGAVTAAADGRTLQANAMLRF